MARRFFIKILVPKLFEKFSIEKERGDFCKVVNYAVIPKYFPATLV